MVSTVRVFSSPVAVSRTLLKMPLESKPSDVTPVPSIETNSEPLMIKFPVSPSEGAQNYLTSSSQRDILSLEFQYFHSQKLESIEAI